MKDIPLLPIHIFLKMFQMRVFFTLLCFSIVWAAEQGSTFEEHGGGVRGPRIVEHKAQADCKQEKEWASCSDEDWGIKCPSGCRMQGLIDETDQEFNDRIDKIKKLLLDNQNSYKKSNILKQEITTVLERNLISEQEIDDSFGQISDDLRRRLVTLKQRVTDQVNRIKVLQNTIRSQVGELKRLEVDVDIKIRACKGSCARVYNYQVDTESYDNIQKQLIQASSINLQPAFEARPMSVLKMRPLKESTVPSHFKTAPLTEQEANILSHIKLVEAVLENSEAESRGPSVATKFVVPGAETSRYPHTAVTTTGGGSDMKVRPATTAHATQTCLRTHTTRIIQGPQGIKEEVIEEFKTPDGSDCSHLKGLVKETGGTYHIKVSSSGGGGSGLPDFSSLDPEIRDFFSLDAGSRLSETASHLPTPERPDSFSDLHEEDYDDFSRIDHASHGLPSKTSGATSTHSKTVVSSSSSATGFNKGGSTFETKSLKLPASFREVEGVQHDESGEDNPDFRARSLNTGGEKQGESYTGPDCEDIHQKHTSGAQSGIFRIKPAGSAKVFSVYCDQETTLGGWLLIQQRLDGSLNFNRTWEDYKKGFGNVDGKGQGEFWLGNENLYLLTQKDTVLRVEVEDWDGNEAYAEYNIHIGSESESYRLSVSDYEGTAGDALIKGSEEEGSEYTAHTNMKFSTFDRDSDQWEENCAEVYGGGWWYNNCQAANLNGIYYPGGQYDPRNNVPYEIENGVVWVTFKPSDYSLKVVRMKIRPLAAD
ncbi:fibrinogen alpha chain [Sceloporus undulatus]|uniref:fibrinogen alpha chain n=1 Tax=Sceloporus undulatus TaxID=8520 RepID=UPI001C4C1F07|nr:fibrinogen alpha chain [Sceloporus undulatus]